MAGLFLGLAFAVFSKGGIEVEDWRGSVGLVGFAGVAWCLRGRRAWVGVATGDRVSLWLFLGLMAWACLQVVPLPLSVLEFVSLRRAEMVGFAGESWGALSVWSEATVGHLVRLGVFGVTFLVVRAVSLSRGRLVVWGLLIAVAVLEALLGIWQVAGGAELARGTYPNRNHFAGLMELAMPPAVAIGLGVLAAGRSRYESRVGPVAVACGFFALAAVMLVAVLGSLSRMGFIGSLAGLGATGLALAMGQGRRWMASTVAAGGAAAVLAFVFLPSDPLILRFADIASTDEISRDTRSQIWSDTVRMVGDYAVAGCGLGGYEDAFTRYQTAAPMNLIDYAHNDYLQVAAEAGLVGLGLGLALVGRVFAGAVRGVMAGGAGRYVAAGCCGSLAALAAHSLTDFNLYIPANGMAAAWVSGIAASYWGETWN